MLLLAGALLLAGCASKGDEMRVVIPGKTTYLHAEARDGGQVDVPPRVLEEVRPTAPEGTPNKPSLSVVARFAIDVEGRISEIEISRATEDHRAEPAAEAISRWRVESALRHGEASR